VRVRQTDEGKHVSTTHGGRRRLLAAAGALALAAAVAVPADAAPPEGRGKPEPRPHYQLTILHNNDGESKLLNAPGQPDFGGVARFATLVDQLRAEALVRTPWDRTTAPRSGVVLLSSGDNFLAGPEFTASLEKGVPFYDSIALDHIGYDAFAIGNHEFDFGPDVLADFISGIDAPFVSANLDVSAEPALAALAADGSIVASTVVRESGARIGVVGATTPALPSISSPRNVEVHPDVAGLVQEQVDTLTSTGVRIIVLISHLQNVEEDRDLISTLSDVDVAIAGGGDELLANDGDLLVPGDVRTLDPDTGEPLPYPIIEKDADGQLVPIVTTAGDYKYVGRLVVDFDTQGEVVRVHDSSGPVRVSGVAPDAVAPDPFITEQVVEPVADFVSDLAENVIAQSQVALEGRRAFVRTSETNLGNLLADALLDAGSDNAAAFGVVEPDVALQNSGGIRNNSLIPAGPITELDTFSIASFSNFVSVVPDVPREQFKEILENAVSGVPLEDGRFAQVAGFSFTYNPAGTAQVVDNDGVVLSPGSRVVDVTLDDGTPLVVGGNVVAGPGIAVATNDFSARGGDQYPFRGLPFTTVGVTYQQALLEYIVEDLNGLISAADYPEGGEGRIVP
jgi:2',3'-cyclic-nucleotide 2'-phosphodiesterase (5'-nucleotidase family)